MPHPTSSPPHNTSRGTSGLTQAMEKPEPAPKTVQSRDRQPWPRRALPPDTASLRWDKRNHHGQGSRHRTDGGIQEGFAFLRGTPALTLGPGTWAGAAGHHGVKGKQKPQGNTLRPLPPQAPKRTSGTQPKASALAQGDLQGQRRGWAAATPAADHSTCLVSRKGQPHPRPLLMGTPKDRRGHTMDMVSQDEHLNQGPRLWEGLGQPQDQDLFTGQPFWGRASQEHPTLSSSCASHCMGSKGWDTSA